MPRTVDHELTEPVARTLKGAIDVGDGGTDEQHSVLKAIVVGFLGRPDLDPEALEPLTPEVAGELITDDVTRRRVREMMVLLESCRHPFTEDQVTLVESYASHLGGIVGPGLTLARVLVRDGATTALADYMRFSDTIMEDIAEPSLIAEHMGKEDHAPELAARLRSFHDLPEGSLGRAYVDFCDRNNLTYPGDNPMQPAVFVAHDMTHVIAGYEPTGPGELALGAFQISMHDSQAHWVAFLGSIAIHEAGYFNENGFVGKESTLTRPGAIDTLTEAFVRGQQCTGDFTAIDHLAMAERPLADIRAEYNVVPVVHDR
jgi:ubiquinone biosynthesis protein Coq4